MTRITTPFGFHSTAAEVAAGVDLTGKRVVITGASSGLGIETARALATTGAELTLAVRNAAAGEQVASKLRDTTGNQAIRVASLDLAEQASIRTFVAAWQGPLHVLINNAGVMAMPETYTPEGWEMQFATNYLGHFALALGLHSALAAADGARVVAVSSVAHMLSPVIFDDLHFAFRPYDPWLAYGQSKTANILFAVGASRRWAQDGICANALMPGAIRTNIQRYIGGELKSPPETRKTPEQGAATTVLLACSPLLAGVSGKYFVDGSEGLPVTRRTTDKRGIAPYALDPGNAERLWQLSLSLLQA